MLLIQATLLVTAYTVPAPMALGRRTAISPCARVSSCVQDCIEICRKWTNSTKDLTSSWKDSNHSWDAGAYTSNSLSDLSHRLSDALEARSTQEQLLRLFRGERTTQEVVRSFQKSFETVQLLDISSFGNKQFEIAIRAFNAEISSMSNETANVLRSQIDVMSGDPNLLLRYLKRYDKVFW